MTRLAALILTVLFLLCTGCHRQSHEHSVDSNNTEAQQTTEQILAMQQLTLEAETLVTNAVKADAEQWVQHEFGWWYRYTHRDSAHVNYMHPPLPRDTCMLIHEWVYDLNGQLLLDAIRYYDTRDDQPDSNKFEEPFAYQIMLAEMVRGDTVIILSPWYAAYGKQGYNAIPPFANIRAQLTLHTTPPCEVGLSNDSIANTVTSVPDGTNEYETN